MDNKQELIKKAADIALENERVYGGCAQCVLSGVKETFGNISDDVFKAATGLAGGIGRSGAACGALTGGTIAISMFCGREYHNFADPDKVRHKTFAMCLELAERFKKAYGSVNCWEIHDRLMGRHFNIADPKEYEEFLAAGGHDDKCPVVCADSVKWVLEILDKEGLL